MLHVNSLNTSERFLDVKKEAEFLQGWEFHVIEKNFCNVATASGTENMGRESSYIENAGKKWAFSFLYHVCLTKYAPFSETSTQHRTWLWEEIITLWAANWSDTQDDICSLGLDKF